MTRTQPDIDRILDRATYEARKVKAHAVEPLHLFVAVCKLEPPELVAACHALSIDLVALRRYARGFAQQQVTEPGELRRVSQRVRAILTFAKRRADGQLRAIEPIDLALAVLQHPDAALQQYYAMLELPLERLQNALEVEALRANAQHAGTAGSPTAAITTAATEKPHHLPVSRDLTALARSGSLGPFVGREEEVRQLIRILLRHDKSSAIILGEAGVGKTALAEALAMRAATTGAAAEIGAWHIVEISLGELLAEPKRRAEVEQKLSALLDAPPASIDPNLILFIDQLDALADRRTGAAGGSVAPALKAALARTPIRLIAATTTRDFEQYIAKDTALMRRFLPLRINEPTPLEARAMLVVARDALSAHHGVLIDDAAIEAAVELTIRYLPDRHLPEKARDALDQAAANRRFQSLSAPSLVEPQGATTSMPRIEREDVAAVIAEWAAVPIDKLSSGGAQRLLALEAQLALRVIGQDAAIAKVARVVRTGLAGLARTDRPYGVFLFVGPTGVGKTELAKALAESLFDSPRALLRFDMSEYHDEHTVQRLIGAPPGYVGYDEGGQLTNAIRRRPHAVLLFDEVEKAHPKVADIFLQLFDEGRLTDGHGRVVDCTHTVIVMTSNLVGGAKAKRPIGPRGGGEPSRDQLFDKLRTWFRLELLNRVSEIVMFEPLTETHIRAIVDKIIDEVRQRLAGRKIELRLDDAVYAVLIRDGFDEELGARQMERLIERVLVQPAAELLLSDRAQPGSTLVARSGANGIVLELEDAPATLVDFTNA